MNAIFFLLILTLLVLVHELGHFLIAKKNGVRVDEFGIGFPPKIFGKKIGETLYSINLLPFGGFVKIFGENAESLEEGDVKVDPSRSLVHKSKFVQAAVLSGGILFNILFAWLTITFGLMVGLPMSANGNDGLEVNSQKLMITSVLPESPADLAGIKPGDVILSLSDDLSGKSVKENLNPDSAHDFIVGSKGELEIDLKRGEKQFTSKVEAKEGLVSGNRAIGISMDMIGNLKLPIYKAVTTGFVMTVRLLEEVTVSILSFFRDVIFGKPDLTSVAGPVGMVTIFGDNRNLGFGFIVFFIALLSANLAIINLMPLPALDGGRLVMVLIEAIKRSPINPKVVQVVNTVGFILLIGLMFVITYHDIVKLF